MLHDDYAPGHTAISVKEVLNKRHIPVVPQPSYLPDLSPCDVLFFPKLKFHLKGRNLGKVDNIQKVMTDQPRALPHEFFQHCYLSGNVSGSVWLPKGTTLMGMMLIFSSVVNNKLYSTFILLFRLALHFGSWTGCRVSSYFSFVSGKTSMVSY
jgi:hypothetical protein